MTQEAQQHRWHVIIAFALVYVFWGSTYLGIRIAIEQIPPMVMTGMRFLTAGSLMLVWCALRGRKIWLRRDELVRLAVLGILLLSVANAVLAWAEQWVPTGLAALIVSVTPIWFLVLETWVFPSSHRPSPRALAGLGLGVAGMFVLLWPQLRHTGALGAWQLIGSVSLLFGSLSWAFGSVLAKRWNMASDPFVASGWEMTFAGAVNLAIGTALGNWAHATWSRRGLGGVVYLIIFGSWVGFSAYVWLLKHVPTPKVATYAYVNPVVAVFLGWLVLDEKVTGYIFAGSVVIISAVSLVSGARLTLRASGEQPGLPAVEAGAD